MNKTNLIGILLFSLIATACGPELDLANEASSSKLTSVKISGGKLATGYKMSGKFNLTVESIDGAWIKTAEGTMSQSTSATLAENDSHNVSVTKNKSYKFTMTGSVLKEDTQTVISVQSCEDSTKPILVDQDNQTIPIRLCDENGSKVADKNSDLTDVAIEPTYTPDAASSASRCPTQEEVSDFIKKYDASTYGFSANSNEKYRIIARLFQEAEGPQNSASAQRCSTLLNKELLPLIEAESDLLGPKGPSFGY